MRLITLFIALNSFVGSAQLDSTIYEMGGVPVPLNDGWGWFDLANNQLSDSLFFQDFLPPQQAFADKYVLKNDSLWGALDGSGFEVLPFVYDSILVINGHIFTKNEDVWNYRQQFFEEDDVNQVVQFDSLYSDGAHVYLYAGGKTGLITPSGVFFPPTYASIHPLTNFNGFGEREEFGYYMVLDGGQYNLLDETGKALLPPNVWDLRSAQKGIFEFRRGDLPEYYSMYSNEIIRPNGRDIVFYGSLGYKMYNESKTKGVLYRYALPVLDEYDDYFFLVPDASQELEYLAVRKNGKVGLLRNGVLQGSIKYDQINSASDIWQSIGGEIWRTDQEVFFLYFIGDSCGLMDGRGVERFAPRYANILATADQDRYIVLDRKLSGVVDASGKTIIPIQYDHISYSAHSELFTVQHNEKIGLFRKDGSVLVPIAYDKHRICSRVNNMGFFDDAGSAVHVLGKKDDLYFANSLGLIDGIAYDHYDYTPGVLKAYKKNGITVFAISETGLVEEVVNYPLYNAAVVEKHYWPFQEIFYGWRKSYVEENQAEGYYGLRLYAERGFGVPPRYRTVRITVFENAMGEVAYQSTAIPFLNEVPMTVIRSYDELNVGTGTVSCNKMYNTEMLMNEGGSSNRRVNFQVTGKQVFSASTIGAHLDMSDGVLYADFQGERSEYRRYFIGGLAEMCPIEEADVSLYDYYVYWNLADACRLDPSWMTRVLDPKMGVRFVNSKRAMINTSSFFERYDDVRSFKTEEDFKSFKFVNPIVYFEQKMGAPFGELKRNVVQSGVEQPIIKDCLNARSVELGFGQVVEAEIKSSELAKIHVEYPNYLFLQNERDVSYNAGRITRQIDSNWVRLISPNNELIWDSCLAVRYLNEKRFGVQTMNGWRLIDRDGNLVYDSFFRSVNAFENNQANFELMDGAALILNVNGEVVQKLPEPPVYLGKNYYYFRGNPSELIDAKSGKSDLLQADEKFLEGYFIKKVDQKTRIRCFGSLESIELELPSALKSFGKRVYCVDKETVISIDSNLTTKKYKKIKSFRTVSTEIGWLEGKRDVLIDQQWNVLHTLTKNERFELRNGDLVILEEDSVKLNFGSLKPTIPVVESTDIEPTPEPEPVVEVVYRDGKFGAVRGDENILPFNYTTLSKLNDEEFFASLGYEIHIYNSDLKRIGDTPFDYFFQTDSGYYVFYSYTGQWSAFSPTLEKIR